MKVIPKHPLHIELLIRWQRQRVNKLTNPEHSKFQYTYDVRVHSDAIPNDWVPESQYYFHLMLLLFINMSYVVTVYAFTFNCFGVFRPSPNSWELVFFSDLTVVSILICVFMTYRFIFPHQMNNRWCDYLIIYWMLQLISYY